MNTFTLDSRGGKLNPDYEWIETQTREKLRDVIKDFTMNCIKNDIEMTSADGLFFGLVMQELSMVRVTQVSELRKREKESSQ